MHRRDRGRLLSGASQIGRGGSAYWRFKYSNNAYCFCEYIRLNHACMGGIEILVKDIQVHRGSLLVKYFSRRNPLPSALIACGLLASACGSTSSSGSTGTTASSAAPIRVGVITALSGPFAALGSEGNGVQAYFQSVNAHGGINGHKVQVFVGNDQFNPALTPGVAAQLVGQDRVQMMCGIAGSADAAAIKPFLAANNVPDVAPASGTPTLVVPPTNTEYEVIPPYEPLAASLVKYAVNVLHKTKIAIVYTNDDVGLPALAGAKWELQQLHLSLAAQVQFSLTATSLAPQAALLKQSGADFVILWHVAAPLALLVNDAAQIGYNPTWGGGFFAATPSFAQLTKNITSGNAYFVSPLDSTTAPVSAGYRAAVTKYQPSVSTTDINVMQGWTLGDACGAVIAKATANGQSFSYSNLVKAANSLSLNDAYVHGLNWTPKSHLGLSTAQVLRQEGSQFISVTGYEPMPNAPLTAG